MTVINSRLKRRFFRNGSLKNTHETGNIDFEFKNKFHGPIVDFLSIKKLNFELETTELIESYFNLRIWQEL